MDEPEAIARLKRGDLTGMETLVLHYQEKAVHAAYLIVHDRALAEDVASAAFLQAYEKIGQFDHTRPFGPWFLRIAVHAAVKAADRQKRFVSVNGDAEDDFYLLADPLPYPEELAERAEDRHTVWQALSQLSPSQRAVVVLRYYLDFSEAEMVVEMQQPLSTIKWLLRSARKRLRGLLHPVMISEPVQVYQPPVMEEGEK